MFHFSLTIRQILTICCFFNIFKATSGSGSGVLYPIMVGPKILAKFEMGILQLGTSATLNVKRNNSKGAQYNYKIGKLPLKMEDDERQSVTIWLGKIRNERVNLILHISLFCHVGDGNKLVPQTVGHQRLLEIVRKQF
jgi:hypothetical protein